MKTYFVDKDSGKDYNDGLSPNTAFKTLRVSTDYAAGKHFSIFKTLWWSFCRLLDRWGLI